MGFRYTSKDVKIHFANFVKEIGGRMATSYRDVGGFVLDENPTYGGYSIALIGNERGGLDMPFGDLRMKAEPFIYAMRFALDTMRFVHRGSSAKFVRRR